MNFTISLSIDSLLTDIYARTALRALTTPDEPYLTPDNRAALAVVARSSIRSIAALLHPYVENIDSRPNDDIVTLDMHSTAPDIDITHIRAHLENATALHILADLLLTLNPDESTIYRSRAADIALAILTILRRPTPSLPRITPHH